MATETWCPFAQKLPITTSEYYRTRSVPTVSAVEHITAGTDSRSWLQNANNGASVHFLIRVEGRKAVVYQFMPIEWAAWGNGRFSRNNPHSPRWIREYINSQPNNAEGNRRISSFLLSSTISIEHEGRTPTAQLYTGPMLEASIALNRWLAETVPTLIVDRDHVIGHYQIDHLQRPFCPGGANGAFFPFERIVSEMRAAREPEPVFEERVINGFTVRDPFLSFWENNGDVRIFGYPTENEVAGRVGDWQGRVQWFQRARFEDHDGVVQLGLVGDEAKVARAKGCIE